MTGDNRIRLDQTPVDFSSTDDVDQNHSDYPSPNTAPRFDLMRSYLIGLLSNQSSNEEPLEKRTGTLWFKKDIEKFLVFIENEWDSLSKYVSMEKSDGEYDSLQNVIDSIMSSIAFVGPRVVWSGVFTSDEVNSIPVPDEFEEYAVLSGMQPFVFVDGILIDPRKTIINEQTPVQINLIGVDTKPNQEFVVKLEKVTSMKSETVPAEG